MVILLYILFHASATTHSGSVGSFLMAHHSSFFHVKSGDGYLIRLFQQQHIGVKIENLLTILGLAQFGMF